MKYVGHIFLLLLCFPISAMEFKGRMLGTEFAESDLSTFNFEELVALKNELIKHLSYLRVSLIDNRLRRAPRGDIQELIHDKQLIERSLSTVQDAIDDKRFDAIRRKLLENLSHIASLRRELGLD